MDILPPENCRKPKNHIVKRRSGEKLEGKEKQIIFNVFNYLRSKNPELSVSRTVEDTAEATGCSTQTVFRIRKEAANGPFKSPSKTKPRKHMNKNSRLIKYDDFVRSIIRNKIHDCLFRNLPLTLNSVMSIVNIDPELPNFKRSTLHKVLNEMGFNYEKKGKHAMYIERPDLITARHNYLKNIRRLRNEKRNIIYMGETIVETVTKLNGDIERNGVQNKNVLVPNGSTAEPKHLIIKYVIVQAGNEHGFVNDRDLIYSHNKMSSHESEITECEKFERWIKDRLLPSLPTPSVVVIDNSSHERWRCDPVPDKTWQRDKIKEWLLLKRVPFKDELLKKDLLDIVGTVKHRFSAHQIEDFVRNSGHTVLRLPIHHYELSPLGLIWGQVKQYVTAHGVFLKADEFERIIWEGLRCVTIDSWHLQMKHVLQVEDRMWRADMLQEVLTKEGVNTLGTAPTVSPSNSGVDGKEALPADQAIWFSDLMRIRAIEGYNQYLGDKQQNGHH